MKTARLELRVMLPRKPEHVADFEAGRAIGWELVLGGDVIGFAALHQIDRRNLCAQLAYEIDVEHRRKGFMTEALQSVIDHAFRELGLHRLEAHVTPSNIGSLRLAEKLGLVREGLLRENVTEDGRFQDTVLLAILSSP